MSYRLLPLVPVLVALAPFALAPLWAVLLVTSLVLGVPTNAGPCGGGEFGC